MSEQHELLLDNYTQPKKYTLRPARNATCPPLQGPYTTCHSQRVGNVQYVTGCPGSSEIPDGECVCVCVCVSGLCMRQCGCVCMSRPVARRRRAHLDHHTRIRPSAAHEGLQWVAHEDARCVRNGVPARWSAGAWLGPGACFCRWLHWQVPLARPCGGGGPSPRAHRVAPARLCHPLAGPFEGVGAQLLDSAQCNLLTLKKKK
jgi:hypothetical protein